nr:MAG TPA: hypothetical protein [Bacteriophage sp.]
MNGIKGSFVELPRSRHCGRLHPLSRKGGV